MDLRLAFAGAERHVSVHRRKRRNGRRRDCAEMTDCLLATALQLLKGTLAPEHLRRGLLIAG